MKFSASIILFVMGVSVQAMCDIVGGYGTVGDPGCCWGGQSGADACVRQTGGATSCSTPDSAQTGNFCVKMGIPSSKCNADCCDIKTGWGQPCPKGKNRCDSESGCPYRNGPGGTLRGS